HTDLLTHKLIPDPFYRDNESKVQWVSGSEWEYRKNITANAALLKHKHIDLVFEGLNTMADVSLNGKLILHTDNMFREWRADIKSYLKPGNNTLSIVFHRVKDEIARLEKTHPEEADTSVMAKMLAAGNRAYVRKAAYEGGWDWGPNMVTCGIWRPVYLQYWETERIMDIGIAQPDITRQAAHISVDLRVFSTRNINAALKINYVQNGAGKSFTYPVTLHTGVNDISYPIDIANPKLWYPNDYGKQDMYNFKVALVAGGYPADMISTKAGLRSVVLDRNPDSLGRTFHFIVNGIPVFAKGANIIPFDHFPTRMTAKRYRHFLQAAADAHMNMMRLWGGGYYETQEFYDLCDEMGLMVWQDFMFANSTPPGFLKDNIAKEVEYQVRRLRNHPCIAVWCGNNETGTPGAPIDPALIPDAFKPLVAKLMSQVTPPRNYYNYYEVYRDVIPVITNRLTPEIPYTPSAPNSDFDKQTPDFISGDTHNYSVWWNNKDIGDQASYKSRFVSETGIQGFPQMATIDQFTLPEDRSATSPVMNAHQKNAMINGNKVIEKIIKTEYKDPADFSTFDYLAQLVQGESLRIYSESMRRRRPFSMGFIYWQLNDSWPVISWATMDYYGRPKAGMYMAKRFFEPVLVSPYEEDGKINIYVVSDKTADEDAKLEVRLMDFNGKVLWHKNANHKIKALASEIALSIPKGELAGANYDDEKSFMSIKLVSSKGALLSSNDFYFKRPKDLKYTKAAIQTDLTKQGDHYVLKLTSNALAPRAAVTFGDDEVSLSDNFVDVLPNEPMYITIHSSDPLEQLKKDMKVTSLNQL
ncbi:MAG TPA: glycoside hydrolase family 2 protein, partial [Mucilaginibacter sp.]|nr:glycoside hydrolase family 2 protein [Mucilaginibacter sp.]